MINTVEWLRASCVLGTMALPVSILNSFPQFRAGLHLREKSPAYYTLWEMLQLMSGAIMEPCRKLPTMLKMIFESLSNDCVDLFTVESALPSKIGHDLLIFP